LKVAIFDCFSGASGDMIVSSLLGITLEESDLREIIKEFDLKIDFEIRRVNKSGIIANQLIVTEEKVRRRYREIEDMLKSSEKFRTVSNYAVGIFKKLAIAEAGVHGYEDYREAHFHQIGSDDAIFDILSATLGILRLREKGYRIFTTPINLGRGKVKTSHGVYPVPPPAVVEVLRNSKLKVYFGEGGELLTPTGAGILAYFSEGDIKNPFSVERVSYGAGLRDLSEPNVLRLILGKCEIHDRIVVLETNIDDISGELIGNAILRLSENCLDVVAIPYFGKKNRPGYIIKAICKEEDVDKVSGIIMEETNSLGVRVIPVHHRVKAYRESEVVRVRVEGREFGIRVKLSLSGKEVLKPEFDDVKKIAEELDLPLPLVYSKVMREIEDKLKR